jgi:site-specific DNA-methyltransferase (adenine-specific)
MAEECYADPESVKLERHEEHVREYKDVEYHFKDPSNPWRFPCVDAHHPERTGVPAQKPVALMERIIAASCPPDGVVLDCFAGSGTTGVACMRLARASIVIDRDKSSLDIARGRFADTDIGGGLV